MSEKYEHAGLPFTKQVAAELIFKTHVGKSPVDETILPKQIYQIHKSGGGLPPESKLSESDSFNVNRRVRQALSGLHTNGCATRDEWSGRLWYIHEMDIHRDEREYPKTRGKGSQEVYCYYYRAYREIAVLTKVAPVWKMDVGKILWECKIGETHEQDTPTRVRQQIGVPPEQPVIALILKTDDSQRLENMIHEILKFWDREIPEAQGKEWFLTSPDEVEHIYQEIQHGFIP